MWGLAATLYHCATGNHPDYISRPAYRWPPSGDEGKTSVERQRWLALLGVVYRATQENASERYIQFRDMANALGTLSPAHPDPLAKQPHSYSRKLPSRVLMSLIGALGALALVGVYWHMKSIEHIASIDVEPHLLYGSPSSNFERKLQAARADFESLLATMRLDTVGDHSPQRDKVNALEKLVKSLETQAGAPMTEIRQTFAQMTAVGPSLHEELRIIDNRKINDDAEKLNAAVTHLRQLAGNADEGFRAGKVADDLLAEITAFQEAGSAWNTTVYAEASGLKDKLHDATNSLVRGREKAGPSNDDAAIQTEQTELYRLSEEVDRKVLDPILNPPF